MENVKRTEQIAKSGPNKGPRVTLDDVLASIAEVHYLNAGDCLFKTGQIKAPYDKHPATLLTICICVLQNNWIVIGKSAPASSLNFDPKVGAKLAHEDCVRQIWPLLGFNLRQELAEGMMAVGEAQRTDPDAAP
jgi:hypothetical protein